MEIKTNQLTMVRGGSFMETIKRNSKIAIGASIGMGFVVLAGLILLAAKLKKKTKPTVQSKDNLDDWEFVTHVWQNGKGEWMVTL